MQDEDYWKNLYRESWGYEGKRIASIAAWIDESTGKKAKSVGLGTGTTEFISGSAAKHGYEKGGADLQVENTNVFLEITGPQVDHIPPAEPLWVRPDKVANARTHYPESETWLVHVLGNSGRVRVVRFDEYFFSCVDKNDFPIVHPKLRGVVETYHAIPANHKVVEEFQALLDYLKAL